MGKTEDAKLDIPTDVNAVSPSLENYLEAIHEIVRSRGVARVRDIARQLKVRMPSVNAAVTRLSQSGLVNHERYEYVELTPEGKEYARRIARRHRMLKRFLSEVLEVPGKVAEHDACQVEHVVSPETMAQLVSLMDFLDTGAGSERWTEKLRLREQQPSDE